MKVTSCERSDSHFRYVVSAKEGHAVAVVFRRRKFGLPQAEGGEVVGWAKSEEVQAFREASDWLSRFLRPDGSPRPDEPVFDGLIARPAEEKA